ncbi:MAG: ABC transporter permease [Deltaproteobacteria bacterium]|jgi:peptide/nickel transport system permease protein|nr:ABC transporter permease [Deltaproteobacteria bacterium]
MRVFPERPATRPAEGPAAWPGGPGDGDRKSFRRALAARLSRLGSKAAAAALTVFCIVSVNFALIRFMPGDPVTHIVGEDEYLMLEASSPETIEAIRAEYGLDGSLPAQFAAYLARTARLDFGSSYRTKGPVLDTALRRMKFTLLLAVPSTALAAVIGGALGLLAGWRKGGLADMTASPVMGLLQTVPANCLAIAFLLLFSFRLGAFPLGGITEGGLTGAEKALDILWHMALPAAVLTLLKCSSDYMLMKSVVASLRDEEYVLTAMSRGYSEWRILTGHVLKNALCPFITSLCMQFGYILSGSMLVEVVFSWPGMGMLVHESVAGKDFPMLQTCFLFMGACVVACNLLADALVLAIDPRVREGGIG